MAEPKSVVDDYSEIRSRMRDGTAQPEAPPGPASDRRRPGYIPVTITEDTYDVTLERVVKARAKLADPPTIRRYRFDRYLNGKLMAEGGIVRASSEAEAKDRVWRLFEEPESCFVFVEIMQYV